jgi:Asp-tRNA(Asn)/Glu-tRNA(Gln) amidotransferase A subunit family amidase
MPGASLPTSVPQRLPLHEWPASDIVRSVATGEFTCEAVVAACLARIAERDATIRAWTNFDPERALAEARALDRAASRGPLHGVPIGVKDVIDTFDMPTEMGSPIYRGIGRRRTPLAWRCCAPPVP